MKLALCLLLPLLAPLAHGAEADTFTVREDFGPGFDSKKFLTTIPNKNTSVRDGVLWTHGSSGGKYPPMVYLALDGKDLTLSFRYRHLEPGGMLWLFVDGDDGHGSIDHMLRVRLNRDSVVLQIDAHSPDPAHPLLQRAMDRLQGAEPTVCSFSVPGIRCNRKGPRTSQLVLFSYQCFPVLLEGEPS